MDELGVVNLSELEASGRLVARSGADPVALVRFAAAVIGTLRVVSGLLGAVRRDAYRWAESRDRDLAKVVAENEEAHDAMLTLHEDAVGVIGSVRDAMKAMTARFDAHTQNDRNVDTILGERLDNLALRFGTDVANLEARTDAFYQRLDRVERQASNALGDAARMRELLWPEESHEGSVLERLERLEKIEADGWEVRDEVWKGTLDPRTGEVTYKRLSPDDEAEMLSQIDGLPEHPQGDPGDESPIVVEEGGQVWHSYAGIGLDAWIEHVIDAWIQQWRSHPSTPPHRYKADFAAFVGERLLTDYNLRDAARRRDQ